MLRPSDCYRHLPLRASPLEGNQISQQKGIPYASHLFRPLVSVHMSEEAANPASRRMSGEVAPPLTSPLRHPPFALFWWARVATTIAFQMQAVAIGWQVYDFTGSALDL